LRCFIGGKDDEFLKNAMKGRKERKEETGRGKEAGRRKKAKKKEMEGEKSQGTHF
jgi:hypothetical protein